MPKHATLPMGEGNTALCDNGDWVRVPQSAAAMARANTNHTLPLIFDNAAIVAHLNALGAKINELQALLEE